MRYARSGEENGHGIGRRHSKPSDGDGLLFVGAGLSFLARRRDNGEPVPDTASLVDLLLEQPPGTGSAHPLDRVAGAVVRRKGVEFVYEILQSHFDVGSVDPRLSTLYALPWKRIYTTNYDNAIEVARTGSYQISSAIVDEPQSRAKIGSIIHLNGYIKRISPANIEKGLLLTDSSYAASRLVETGWLSFFEHDINTSRSMIFAGYSLYDLEIDKVLLATEGLARRVFFHIAKSGRYYPRLRLYPPLAIADARIVDYSVEAAEFVGLLGDCSCAGDGGEVPRDNSSSARCRC
jgi:hypothetical protein